VIIPIGLLIRAISAAQDAQTQSDMAASSRMYDQHRGQQWAHLLWEACSNERACLVVLADNDWNDCTFDGVRLFHLRGRSSLSLEAGGYRGNGGGAQGQGPHGFVGVFPGRHVVTTVCNGYAATMTMALHPGEAYCLRLNHARAEWTICPRGETERIVDLFSKNELPLLPYNQTIATPLLQREAPRTVKGALDGCLGQLKQVRASILANNRGGTLHHTTLAGNALLGVPLENYAPITAYVGFEAFELAGKGKLREAWELLQAGLYVLPDNPTLLSALGQFQLGVGEKEHGRAALRRALEREAGLDADLRARTETLLSS
jgi:hypothetical protein